MSFGHKLKEEKKEGAKDAVQGLSTCLAFARAWVPAQYYKGMSEYHIHEAIQMAAIGN